MNRKTNKTNTRAKATKGETKMTTKNAKTTHTIDRLMAEVEECLAELQRLGNKNKVRRAIVQTRYANLSSEIRQAFSR